MLNGDFLAIYFEPWEFFYRLVERYLIWEVDKGKASLVYDNILH